MRRVSFLAIGMLTLALAACTRTPSPATGNPSGIRRTTATGSLENRAASGDGLAAFELGARYHDGDGKPKDFAQALHWFTAAADANEPRAQFNLGMMYENGEGVAADDAKAMQWLQRAADNDSARALYQVALHYYLGEGTSLDYAKAKQYFLKAANRNVPDAQFNLAVMEVKGQGGPQDLQDAYAWFSVAKAQGYAPAGAALQKLGTALTDDQKKAAAKHALELELGMSITLKR